MKNRNRKKKRNTWNRFFYGLFRYIEMSYDKLSCNKSKFRKRKYLLEIHNQKTMKLKFNNRYSKYREKPKEPTPKILL